MTSDKEKDMLEDEEIIDLTDVLEDAPDDDFKKEQKHALKGADQNIDPEMDLNDLFYSFDREKDAGHSDDNEFEQFFKDEVGQPEAPDEEKQEVDLLEGFPENDQLDDHDQPGRRHQDRSSADVDDLLSGFNDSTESGDYEIADKFNKQPAGWFPEKEDEMSGDLELPDDPEPGAEPGPGKPSGFHSEEWEDGRTRLDDLIGEEIPGSGLEKPLGAIATLAEQLEFLSDRMDVIESKFDSIQTGFSEMTVNVLEERGPELSFLNKMLQDLKKDLSSAIEEGLDLLDQDSKSFSGKDFKTGVLEAVEEKGLELSFVRDLGERITRQTRELIDEKIFEALQTPEPRDESDLGQKIQELDRRLGELAWPDPEELKKDIRVEVEKILGDKMSDLTGSPDAQELKQEINQVVENRLNSLVESWQTEKQSLTSDLEDTVRSREKMQERLNALSLDMAELREKMAEPDSGLMERFASVEESAVTRENFESLSARLKVELEEHVLNKVPEAAARVIREEIAAIVSERKK